MTPRIIVTDIRPKNGFVYAREDFGGAIWRFNKHVPNKHLCKFVAAVQCQGTIDPRLWTLVQSGSTRIDHPLSQLDMDFDYPNQEEAA
jgi:hypothetical protein